MGGIDGVIREILSTSDKYVTMIVASDGLFLNYVNDVAKRSNAINIKVIIEGHPERFVGLLGRAKLMRPSKPLLSSKSRLKRFIFPTRDGESDIRIEMVMISDHYSAVIYLDGEVRTAVRLNGSIVDSFLRYYAVSLARSAKRHLKHRIRKMNRTIWHMHSFIYHFASFQPASYNMIAVSYVVKVQAIMSIILC